MLSTLLGLAAVAATRRTPFGEVDASCVLTVPDGTLVDESEDGSGLTLSHPQHGTWKHEAPAHCSHPRDFRSSSSSSSGGGGITCTSLPCNNWIDNAGWQQGKGETPIGGFSARYLVPATPTKTGPGQTLFYFIGAENTDGQPRHGQPPPSGRSILQPVLTYDPDGWCKTSTTGWCFSSWNCCPKNITVHTDYIQDVTPFDSFQSAFNYSKAADEYLVSGVSAATGKSATLRTPRSGRNYNWADATLEVYQITSCDMFSPSRMSFSEVMLWDVDGKELTPSWTLSAESPCSGSITVDPEKHGAIHIGHQASSVE